MKLTLITAVVAVFATTAALAQSPYTGLQTRGIKALSEQQIADLRAGRGMGLALPAELNGYPGPSHVLELADKLELSDAQRTRMRELFEAMKSEALPLGEKLLTEEGALDWQFADRSVTPETLKAATVAIGATQAELRYTHLKYHLSTLDVLSPEQAQRYAALRGYTMDAPQGSGAHRHHHR